MENILIFCAHNDDQVIGAGGTIAKYSNENKKIIVVIFSYGESSNPILKKDIITELRINEAKIVGEKLKIEENIFLGLPDGKLFLKINNKKLTRQIETIISHYEPNKIFVHSASDMHADHQAVHRIVSKALNNSKREHSLYVFDVWNPFSIIKRGNPSLYIDISKTFKLKLNALKSYKSQLLYIYLLLPLVYLKARYNGFKNKCKYAEKFYKVR